MKWPFMKFYTRDWQSDPELRMCSLESRGYWFECLCIMHTAKRRGYLETPNGHPLSDGQTARLMATFKGDVLRCKDELLENGVPSVEDESGVWYCRRMVKETRKAEKCSIAAKRGGGNPNLSSRSIKTIDILETRNHISLKVTFKGRIIDIEGVEGIPIEAYDLAAILATNISRKDPELRILSESAFNSTMNNWGYQFKEIESEGRSWKEINSVLTWAMDEPFWGSRITTADKFRNKFSDLFIQSNGNKSQPTKAKKLFK